MSNNDNIEQNFRDAFDPESISNQGWNDPSDSVWAKINSDLSEKEPSKFGYGFFILLTGLLLSLLSVGYLIYQNNNLNDQLEGITIELENCSYNASADNIHSPKSTIQRPRSISDKDVTAPLIDNAVTGALSTKTSKKTNRSKHDSSKNKKEINSSLSVLKNEAYIKPQQLLSAYTSESYNTPKSRIYNVPTTTKPEIPLSTNSLININPLVSPILILNESSEIDLPSIKIIESTKARTPRSIITISGGMSNSMLRTNGSHNTVASELIDQEYANLGSLLEAKYTTSVSDRWSLSACLGISHQSYVTEYDISLPYEISKEIIENGAGHIDFEHSLPTSFGNTDTQLTLLRSSADQPLNETIVDIDFDTKHQFLSLQAPMSVDYIIQDISSGFFVGVDLIPSYILSAKSGISSVVSNHSDIESVNNSSTSAYESLQRLNLAVGGHIGYRLPITEQSGVELSGRYTRNINSHFTTDNFNSQSHGVQFSAGYFFRF